MCLPTKGRSKGGERHGMNLYECEYVTQVPVPSVTLAGLQVSTPGR